MQSFTSAFVVAFLSYRRWNWWAKCDSVPKGQSAVHGGLEDERLPPLRVSGAVLLFLFKNLPFLHRLIATCRVLPFLWHYVLLKYNPSFLHFLFLPHNVSHSLSTSNNLYCDNHHCNLENLCCATCPISFSHQSWRQSKLSQAGALQMTFAAFQQVRIGPSSGLLNRPVDL